MAAERKPLDAADAAGEVGLAGSEREVEVDHEYRDGVQPLWGQSAHKAG